MNEEYVRRNIIARTGVTEPEAERLREDVRQLLGNLVHYRSGGGHEADDVILTATRLWEQRKR